MALILEPFYSTNMWTTNVALIYYFWNARFESALEGSVVAAPKFVKDNIICPVLYFYQFMFECFVAVGLFIFAVPSMLYKFAAYWDARFLFFYR